MAHKGFVQNRTESENPSTAALNRSHRDLWMSPLLNIWITCMIKDSRKERRLVAWLAGSPYLGGKVIVEARYQAS
jgi:hypothetical protein